MPSRKGRVWETIDIARRRVHPMTMDWFDRIKTYVGWDLADQTRIAELRGCIDSDFSDMIQDLGEQLVKFKGTQSLMTNKRFVRRFHSVLREWLNGLLDGTFDNEYVKKRAVFGQKLAGVDLTFEDMILLEQLTRKQLFRFAEERLGEHPDALSSTMHTLDKALNLDLTLIYSAYLEVRDAEMKRALLNQFLTVTGFSRTLYENLAEARGGNGEKQ
ncbi:MAG: hypothetical protein GY832_21695 [Chloroflexi bacterium]|nr:hypothetical protein [Chloroflexota bacterium]